MDVYGTDIGPVHSCGGTIYEYQDAHDGFITTRCVACNGTTEFPIPSCNGLTAEVIRKRHQELADTVVYIAAGNPSQKPDGLGRQTWDTMLLHGGKLQGQVHFTNIDRLERRLTSRGMMVQRVSPEAMSQLCAQAKLQGAR